MISSRQPLSRWRYPSSDCLGNNVFPSGRPGFAPFPTITSIMNAALCPRAIYHDLMHGIDNALIPQYGKERDRGELFHNFIGFLKNSIKSGTLTLSGPDARAMLGTIQALFIRYSNSHGISTSEATELLSRYVEPWVTRKLTTGELTGMTSKDDLAFEISLANARVEFELDDGVRHYPLRGRIDEIDLTRRRLIERTTKGTQTDEIPPLLKDFQLWLGWKTLTSLETKDLPIEWRDVDFSKFELIVETPFKDFKVENSNPNFLASAHCAFAWINDISISESSGVTREVMDNAACNPLEPHPDCAHRFINCFQRDFPYPQCRAEIKKTFKPWYTLLLWEKIWRGDLYQYQLILLEREDLVRQGLISEGKIISIADNKIKLCLEDGRASSIRGYDRYTIILFGTLKCGKRESATLVDVSDNQVTMELHDDILVSSKSAILLPQQSDALQPPIMQDPPTYLMDNMRRNLLRLQHSGVIKPDRAKEQSQVQLLESIFGRKSVRRGSK